MIPERDRIKTVMTTAEIAAAMERGDYSAEMLLQHLVRRYNETERELEQERQDRKQADLDTIRALGERNDARALADRLAGALQWWGDYSGNSAPASIDEALAAWKEARSATL